MVMPGCHRHRPDCQLALEAMRSVGCRRSESMPAQTGTLVLHHRDATRRPRLRNRRQGTSLPSCWISIRTSGEYRSTRSRSTSGSSSGFGTLSETRSPRTICFQRGATRRLSGYRTRAFIMRRASSLRGAAYGLSARFGSMSPNPPGSTSRNPAIAASAECGFRTNSSKKRTSTRSGPKSVRNRFTDAE